MKEYQRVILWRDYFASTLTRKEGRRIPQSRATRSPTLEEIIEACRRAGYDPQPTEAFFPARSHVPSGYVSVEKKKRKVETIQEVASMLTQVRGESRSVQSTDIPEKKR